MIKKMSAVVTSVVAGLAVVGVAWAGGDAQTPASLSASGEAASGVTVDDSASASLAADASTSLGADAAAAVDDDTRAAADAQAEARANASASTASSIEGTTSTSVAATTSTSFDESDARQVPDGVSTHLIPGVGTVTIEVKSGQLILVSVSAPGWKVERDKIEPDRIELEFTSGLKAEAEFEARLKNGRVEVEIEVDLR